MIILEEFPTHIAKTNNKIAPNKMLKINNQAIYNGFISRFTRNIVVNNMKDYVKSNISKNLQIHNFPVYIEFHIYTVRNHGSISMRNGKVCWKPSKKDYKPNWDIENLATAWIKVICDSLIDLKIIPDDNVEFVKGISYKFIEVEQLQDRKIKIIIK